MSGLELLAPLWGHGVHALCGQNGPRTFGNRGFYADPADLLAAAERLAPTHDLWWGVNPFGAAPVDGRGGTDDVVAVHSLYVDLDWLDEAHADTALPSEPEVRGAIAALPITPTHVVNTGHGLHCYYRLAHAVLPDLGASMQLRLHDALRRGGVKPERRDLASVLRVPGTFNRKRGGATPITLEHADDRVLDPIEVWRALEPPPEPVEPERIRLPSTPRPGQGSAADSGATPAEWFNDTTDLRHVLVADGWTFHSTDTFEGVPTELWTRPGKSTRDGHSARLFDSGVLLVWSESIPGLPPGRYDAFEYHAATRHRGDKAAAASELRRREMPRTTPEYPLSGRTAPEQGLGATTAPDELGRFGERASSIQSEHVEWLWPGRLPIGKLVVFDGDPALGKSVVSLDLAARVTTGRGFPDETMVMHRPGNVMIFTAEDGLADTVVPRLEAADANLDRVVLHSEWPSGMFDATGAEIMRLPSMPDDLHMLRRLIEAEQARLVIFDVLVAYMGQGLDMNSDKDVRAVLSPLSKVAEATGACIVALRHLNKNVGVSAMYRGGGSIGISGAARVGLLAGVDPDDTDIEDVNQRRKVLAVSKVNISTYSPSLSYRTVPNDEGVVRVEWLGAVRHTADELVAPPPSERDGDNSEAETFLNELLANGPVNAKDVLSTARLAGVTEYQLRKAKRRLKVASHQASVGDYWYWILPDTTLSDHATTQSDE